MIDNDFLRTIRKNLVGRILIGTTYNPKDFFYYFLGACVALFTLLRIKRPRPENQERS